MSCPVTTSSEARLGSTPFTRLEEAPESEDFQTLTWPVAAWSSGGGTSLPALAVWCSTGGHPGPGPTSQLLIASFTISEWLSMTSSHLKKTFKMKSREKIKISKDFRGNRNKCREEETLTTINILRVRTRYCIKQTKQYNKVQWKRNHQRWKNSQN